MKRRKGKVQDLVSQLIESELETELTKMVKKAKAKAVRQSVKLKEYLQLPYVKDEVIEAEVIEEGPIDGENSEPTLKKNSFRWVTRILGMIWRNQWN